MMTFIFYLIGILLLSFMAIVLIRACLGPSALDRVISVNIIGTKTTVLLIIIGFIQGNVEMYVDLALTYALLSFLGTLVIARYIQKKKTRQTWEAMGVHLKFND